MTGKSLKIFFYSMDACGHINACVGVAQTLAKRGHRIYLVLNKDFKSQYEQYGFDLILLSDDSDKDNNDDKDNKNTGENHKSNGNSTTTTTTKNGTSNGDGGEIDDETEKSTEHNKNPFKKVAKMYKELGLMSSAPPLEKLITTIKNNFAASFFGKIYQFNPQIEAAIKREQPDAIIMDQTMIPPAVKQANIPWMAIFSCNPLYIFNSTDLPPPFSGYPIDGDRSDWPKFMQLFEQAFQMSEEFQDELNKHFNYVPPKEDKKLRTFLSPYLNIYAYPEELDYHDVITIPDIFTRIDAFCRETPEPFVLPSTFDYDPSKDKLIYLSMGSMGSIDLDLMRKVLAIVARTPHKYIVSKGALADEFDLPPNCWGESYLPQTNILPMVDLVITHGGNNTVTESFYYGKPMVVMPLFVDQYDNAQRLTEKGYGIRIDPYSFEPDELLDAIERMLNNTEVTERLAAAVKRMRQSQSKEKVCDRIEEIVYRDIERYKK